MQVKHGDLDLHFLKVHESTVENGMSRTTIEECCLGLLHDEWPSQDGESHRRKTLQSSSDALPCTFVLASQGEDVVTSVVAHCILRKAGEVSDGRAVILYSVVVAPEFRGRGIGRLLLRCVEDSAAVMGFSCTNFAFIH